MLSVVIPTLRNYELLARVVDGFARQHDRTPSFEVLVVVDPEDPDPGAADRAIGRRTFPVRRLTGAQPGASGNRNTGWRAACGPIVLFTDDDTVPAPDLVAEHISWHQRFAAPETAVLGHIRWAPGLKVTPFMKWLDRGVQFDFGAISGIEATWAHLYSSNSSLKRSFLKTLGGYDEDRFPYGYEDLDLGIRGRERGLRVVYNRRAEVEHWRAMTVELWQARAPRLAFSEWRFCRRHPEFTPWFWRMFSEAVSRPPQRGRAARAAQFVPRQLPWLGPLVWNLADLYWRQQIAPAFLAAWSAAEAGGQQPPDPGLAALRERSAGSAPGTGTGTLPIR